jgi:hypothetical protein
MLIALLAVLGVNLIVIVFLIAGMLARRRWLTHHGAFKGEIRVVDAEVDGLGPKWKRGYGRWIREVLVWTKAPLLISSQQVAVDGVAGEARPAQRSEVKHLGATPRIVTLTVDGGGRSSSRRKRRARPRRWVPSQRPVGRDAGGRTVHVTD